MIKGTVLVGRHGGWVFMVTLGISLLLPAHAQGPQDPQTSPTPAGVTSGLARQQSYLLGPNDVIVIQALQAEEISNHPIPVDSTGSINLPRIGRIQAMGMTVEQLEAEIVNRLKAFVREPQVVVTVTQFRTDTVYLTGPFVRPGTYPLQGKRRLSELLSAVGGLQPGAERRIRVTRQNAEGRIPLPAAVDDPARKVSVIEIDVRQLLESVNSPEDILIMPDDMIAARSIGKIYISGAVARSGAIDLNDRDSMPVSQVVSIAGLSPEANPSKALILRPIMDTNRKAEIPVDLKRIMSGQANDIPLLPNDVFVIPARKAGVSKMAMYIIPSLITALVTTGIYAATR
jgi:polysaccharide export outer membrane protein